MIKIKNMYLDVSKCSNEQIKLILEKTVEQYGIVINRGKDFSGKVQDNINKCKELYKSVLQNNKLIVLEIYGPTWYRIKYLFPDIVDYPTKDDAINAIKGQKFFVGQEVIVYYTKKYGGTKKRKISKITDSSIYFENLSIPLPLEDIHRLYIINEN